MNIISGCHSDQTGAELPEHAKYSGCSQCCDCQQSGAKGKRLWTDNGAGDKITFEQLDTAAEEADFVARDIARRVRKGEYQYKDCAILYRTNAQSRLFEERFITANIPYKIFGGVNFYARKEVKDLLAYLKTIDNGQDDLAVRRIINIPKRGIGAASINKVALYAQEQEISFMMRSVWQNRYRGWAKRQQRSGRLCCLSSL